MFGLTHQEKTVILFVSLVALIGIGAKYCFDNLAHSIPTPIIHEEVNNSSQPKLININTATFEQLMQLPGIGRIYAWRIIEFRNLHGNFISTDDLKKVKGIGPKKLEKIKEHVILD